MKSTNHVIGLKLARVCPREWKPPLKFENMELPRDCVTRVRELGAGCFGEVYYGRMYGTIEVAVKSLKQQPEDGRSTDATTRAAFLEEAKMMHKLNDQHIVQIVGIVTKGDPVLLISEYMRHGALDKYLREHRDEMELLHLLNVLIDVRLHLHWATPSKGQCARTVLLCTSKMESNRVAD